jgi:hypothetical protein
MIKQTCYFCKYFAEVDHFARCEHPKAEDQPQCNYLVEDQCDLYKPNKEWIEYIKDMKMVKK